MRRLLLVAGAAGALMLFAACGEEADTDDSVASVDEDQDTESEAAEEDVSREEAMLNFVQCMRDNGVEDMPDPADAGALEMREEIMGDPDFEAAQEACQDELPGQGEAGEGPNEELVLEFVECMRDNGVEDMPDPGSGGGIMMDQAIADDPEFEAAVEACEELIQEMRG